MAAHVSRSLAIVLGLVLTVASPLVADQQEGRQEPAQAEAGSAQPAGGDAPALTSQSAPKKGSSLAEAAARIRLTQPTSDGSLVISNATLKKSGASGSMSVGGGVTAAAGGQQAAPAGSAEGTNPANALVQQYNEQLRTVESLEVRLKNFDEQLKQPARDPHYPYLTSRPHDRAPGVQDPAGAQRDALVQQLEAERVKLNTLRDRARRQGVPLG